MPWAPTSVKIGGLSQAVLLPKPGDAQSTVDNFLGKAPAPALSTEGIVLDRLEDLAGDVVGVARVGVAGGVAAGLGEGAGAGGDDGCAARHRLDAREAEALVPGGQDEGARAGVQAREVGVGDVAEGSRPAA